MWSIQSWQQPQLGSFQTSTAVALLAAQAGRAAQAAGGGDGRQPLAAGGVVHAVFSGQVAIRA